MTAKFMGYSYLCGIEIGHVFLRHRKECGHGRVFRVTDSFSQLLWGRTALIQWGAHSNIRSTAVESYTLIIKDDQWLACECVRQ